MSELKDIVPPLELCKFIPAEEFEDSVLVWVFDHQKARKYFPETNEDDRFFYVENREFVEDTIMSFAKCGVGNWINRPPMISAPTLAEQLDELGNKTVCLYDGIRYEVSVCIYERDSGTKEHQWRQYGEADRNPAAAALRLWLKVRGRNNE